MYKRNRVQVVISFKDLTDDLRGTR